MFGEEFERYWDYLEEMEIATTDELSLACALCGSSAETMQKVLFIKTGYRSIEQIEEEYND